MRFGAAEVARARTLKAVGFPWRPRIGDWYMDHTGYCGVVRSFAEIMRVRGHGHVFLPGWDDCRTWLSCRGWGHPEFVHDGDQDVTLLLTHESGPTMRVTGVSDLDCLYRIILQILLSGR